MQPQQVTLLKPWLQTENASGLKLSNVPVAGYTYLGANLENGDFKKSQQPEKDKQFMFHSSRYQPLKGGVIYGSFNYAQQYSDNVRWNDLLNPYRGTPYNMVDSIGGNWKKQLFDMEVKAATGLLAHEKLVLGAGLQYSVGTGARQNDPRPLNNSGDFNIKPSLIYLLGKKHQIGINGLYGFYNETVSFEVKNTTVTHSLYKLLGLGQYASPPTILSTSANRNYNGKRYGGAFQYNLQVNRWQWLTEVAYTSYEENVTDGSGLPVAGGTYKRQEYGGTSTWLYTPGTFAHRVSVGYQMIDGSGIESHQKLIDGFWKTILEAKFYAASESNARLEYMLVKNKTASQYAWYAKAGVSWNDVENKYLVPYSRQHFSSIRYDVTGAYTWSFGKYSGLEAQVYGAYQSNIDGYLNYLLMTSGTNIIAQRMLYPDHDYYTANMLTAGAGVQYHFSWKEAAAARFFIKLNGITTQRTSAPLIPTGPDGGRNRFVFTIGAFY
ncbi:hypothetical protein DVR12_01960 [Chitinophaga silvatica]|uniref:DUF6850 domain-containing protein n=1 Tax=Chitinophaga silvatica TaxID=2282649 RepID=A0A3E1YGM7_9BACT|nr:hypothetical protein DVR12_01960 [Chitinophaga silvatica]